MSLYLFFMCKSISESFAEVTFPAKLLWMLRTFRGSKVLHFRFVAPTYYDSMGSTLARHPFLAISKIFCKKLLYSTLWTPVKKFIEKWLVKTIGLVSFQWPTNDPKIIGTLKSFLSSWYISTKYFTILGSLILVNSLKAWAGRKKIQMLAWRSHMKQLWSQG